SDLLHGVLREMECIVKTRPKALVSATRDKNGEGKFASSVGVCPVCGQPVLESDKSFYCSGYKSGCKFSIWKTGDKGIYPILKNSKKNVTKTLVKALLKNKEAPATEFVSIKTGKKFTAKITLTEYAPQKYGMNFSF
ncbi:MAG: hypothetical protein RR415_09375, partial [Ruthenibacterium sp.]